MATTLASWSRDEIEFANALLRNGAFASDVAVRVTRKFKTARTTMSVKAEIGRGTLAVKKKEKDKPIISRTRAANIVAMRQSGFSKNAIAAAVGTRTQTVNKILKRDLGETKFIRAEPKLAPDEFAHLHREDDFADIGLTLHKLPDCGCRYPVARWPRRFPVQRFCGAFRTAEVRNGKTELSSIYCEKHFAICKRQEPAREAAE